MVDKSPAAWEESSWGKITTAGDGTNDVFVSVVVLAGAVSVVCGVIVLLEVVDAASMADCTDWSGEVAGTLCVVWCMVI